MPNRCSTLKCQLLAQEGSIFCPRHTFLHDIEQQQAAESAAAEAPKPEPKSYDGIPRTRRELFERGYKFTGSGQCRLLLRHIEWWKTPTNRAAPYNSMPQEDSPAVSHFSTCERAQDFRRAG